MTAPPKATPKSPPKPGEVRQWIGKRAALITVVCVALISVSWFFLYKTLRSPPIPVTYAYYYDLGTSSIFVDTADKVPPFASPSGKAGPKGEPLAVRAFVFSCSNCDDESKRFVAYLQQYTPEGQKRVLELVANDTSIDSNDMQADARNSGFVIRATDGELWYPPDSTEGDGIIREARAKCDRGFPSPCFPVK